MQLSDHINPATQANCAQSSVCTHHISGPTTADDCSVQKIAVCIVIARQPKPYLLYC